MIYSSTEFLFAFLPIVLVGFYASRRIAGHRVAIAWLILASLFFYAWWNPKLLPLLVGSIAVNYALGRMIAKFRDKSMLILGITLNLGLLGYFKYTDFLIGSANHAFDASMPLQGIALPLAISFFTFQQIAYLVDVHQGKTTDQNFLNYCLFVSFFPQLIAGPIVHHSEMIPQFREEARFRFEPIRFAVGAAIFFIGLYKKAVLADGIAPYSDRIFDSALTTVPGMIEAWSGALAYSFQIYFDFSGYSDMAIGLAFAIGLRLPLNFNSPYKAVNIIEFWRCWHMTLSRFLRDYVYFPLGGNRKGPSRRYVNLMITMLLGGLWHGAGWTFVLWGGMHGALLCINHAWHMFRRRLGHDPSRSTPLGRAVACLITFLAVVVAWVFFRASDWQTASVILQGMVDLGSLPAVGEFGKALATGGYGWLAAMFFIVWALPNSAQLLADFNPVIEDDGRKLRPITDGAWGAALKTRAAWLAPGIIVIAGISTMVVLARGDGATQFIYMVF